jgi:hypothetical protein
MSDLGMQMHETPKFSLGEDETGSPCFYWVNPWSGKKEKIASLWWPSHPEEATAYVEQLFEELHLSVLNRDLVQKPEQYHLEAIVYQASGVCDSYEAAKIAKAVINHLTRPLGHIPMAERIAIADRAATENVGSTGLKD